MKKYILVLFVMIAMLFNGCGATEIATPISMIMIAPSPTIEPVTIIEETLPMEIAPRSNVPFVSEYAMEDYLLPFEDYSRARKYAPEFVMIHFCSAIVNHPDDPYNLQYVRDTFIQYNVSPHYIIERDGTIHCYIPENRVAWHAGKGAWQDNEKYKNNMNNYSIGIELVAIGSFADMSIFMSEETYEKIDKDLLGYTDAQYEALNALLKDLCNRHDIPFDREHIIGHEEYSSRKTDPGELFDWSRALNN